jgi:hypothetical protein
MWFWTKYCWLVVYVTICGISPGIYVSLGSSKLFSPAISRIWPAFGRWQAAISSAEIKYFCGDIFCVW